MFCLKDKIYVKHGVFLRFLQSRLEKKVKMSYLCWWTRSSSLQEIKQNVCCEFAM